MLLCKFDKGRNRVTIDMDIINHTPQFAALWENDTSADKEDAINKFRLIFHMHDPRSQYFEAWTDGVLKKIVDDLFPNLKPWLSKSAKDKVFQEASKLYLAQLNLVPEWNLLRAAQDAVHRLAKQVRDPKNENAIRDLEQMNKAVKNLREMKKTALDAEAENKTKGNHHVRRREDPPEDRRE